MVLQDSVLDAGEIKETHAMISLNGGDSFKVVINYKILSPPSFYSYPCHLQPLLTWIYLAMFFSYGLIIYD